MRKLLIAENREGQAVMLDVEVEKQRDSENLRTSYIYRERLATDKEVLLYHTGFAYFLKF